MFNYEFKRSKKQEQTYEYEKKEHRVYEGNVQWIHFLSQVEIYIVEAQQHFVVLAPTQCTASSHFACNLHSNESVLNEFIKVHRI